MALLAAGTGLGQSFLVWDAAQSRYRIVPSEGGHSDFAPHTEQQIELLRFMKRRYLQVSWELILSGRGFRTLHEFLAPEVKHATFEDPDADPAPEITRNGLAKTCPICVETLDLWTSIYGAEAGNLALKVLALGGVFVEVARGLVGENQAGLVRERTRDRDALQLAPAQGDRTVPRPIRETHRVHAKASSAIIRAQKPA